MQNSEEGEEIENDIEENAMDDEDDDNDDESNGGSDDETLNEFESNVLDETTAETEPEPSNNDKIGKSKHSLGSFVRSFMRSIMSLNSFVFFHSFIHL